MAKAGRKRKLGAREPNGCIQRKGANQTREDTMSVAVAQRIKIGAGQVSIGASLRKADDYKGADHPDWGHTLGVLRLKGIIDKRQMTAGNTYMDHYFRYCILKGFPPRNPKVASYAQMIAGMSSGEIPDDETVKRAEVRVKKAQAEVINSLGNNFDALAAYRELERFTVNQEHPGQCTPARAGPLRQCLNVLAKHYGI